MGANNVGYMIVTLEQLRASMGVHRVHIDKGLIWDGKDCCFSKLYEVGIVVEGDLREDRDDTVCH